MPNINLKEVYDLIKRDYETGLTERKEDKSRGIESLMEAIGLFDESYGKGAEKTALADYEQSAVSRGLSGSTRGAAVSTGMKHQFEDVRRGRLGDALTQLSQFLSSFQSGAPTAGNLGYIATGGFGAQSSLEAQRFAQDQASAPSIINRSVGGQGSGGLGGSPSPFQRSGSVSGSVADSGDSGGAWGGLAADVAKETSRGRGAPTFAGMEANYGIQGERWLGDGEPLPWEMTTPDWAEEAAAAEAYQGGWTG